MHQHLARLFIVTLLFMLAVGCSGKGTPTQPDLGNQGTDDITQGSEQVTDLTPSIITSEPEERVLGNFYYYSKDEELLAWGTVLVNSSGWDYRLDYIGPKLRALRRSEVTREAQAVIDLTWLNLISCGVAYTNKPVPIPPDFATYEPGEFMDYRVDIQNNFSMNIPGQTVVATQVSMFNIPLGTDARDIWNDVTIPLSGTSLYGDWTVEPWLPDGIYFTRIRTGFQMFGGYLTVIIFDSKAGAFKVEEGGGPELFDPVAKGVTTTPVVAVGEPVHVQDNGSFDPDGGPIILYEWDFDEDGVFDAVGPAADTSYDAPGVYYINLKVTDDENDTDDLTDDPGDELIEITVTPPPVPPIAIATASAFEAYTNVDIDFDGSDSYDPDGGDIVLYEWDWDGDGTFDEVGAVKSHSWDTAGTYYVQLRVTDDETQQDILDEPLEIVITDYPDPPVGCFTYLPEEPIVCETVEFDAGCSTSDGLDIVLYEWDFDNDDIYEIETDQLVVEHIFYETGDFLVKLRVTDTLDQQDEFSDTVEVGHVLPTAIATWDDPEPPTYVGDTITFDASDSHDNDCEGEAIELYEWDFDGDMEPDAEGAIVEWVFDTPGLKEVQMRVTDDEGGWDVLDEPLFIDVLVLPEAPVALGDADPHEALVCEEIHFFDNGSYDPDGGDIVLYEWDFDGDGTYDFEGPDAFHIYFEVGSYEVQLRVTDDESDTDILDEPILISIGHALPTAIGFESASEVEVDEPVQFFGHDSHDNDCENQEIVKWEWDFDGDGMYDAEGETTEHAYSEPGIYEVQLQVTDDEGGTDTLDEPIIITVTFGQFMDPIAIAGSSATEGFPCYSILFYDDGSYDPDGGDITLYEWDFDDDGIFEESGTELYHYFPEPGEFEIQLKVTDDENATDTLDEPIIITIENALPTAVAELDKTVVFVGDPILFDGTGSYDNDCNGESIEKWEWDFDGDGTIDSWESYGYWSYDEPGVYPVQLTVTDDEGGIDMLDEPIMVTVTINYMDPIAYATASQFEAPVCYSITFMDDGSYDPDGGEIQLYEWDFDEDGIYEESGSEVSHYFDTPGVYLVQLQVTDDESATDILDEPLEIHIVNMLPTAVIDAPGEALVNELIQFDGSGSFDNDCNGHEIVNWRWDWENDGNFDDYGEFASHLYTEPGIYYVQLEVEDNEGGFDLLDEPHMIVISEELADPIAIADAIPNPQIICEDVTFDAGNSYDPDGGDIVLYEWDWNNDGSFEYSTPDPITTYTWNTVGTFYVNLRVTDDEGATDELDSPLMIMMENALPTAVGEADKQFVLEDETINFNGTGSHDNDCGGTITNWDWDWENDGNFDDAGEFVSHSYPTAGTYYVNLRVTDDENSTDDIDQLIVIEVSEETFDPIADADVYPNPVSICEDFTLDGSASYDPDGGNIVMWEWDFNNNGTYDELGETFIAQYDVPGTYFFGLRVTDDEGATDTLDTPLELVVVNDAPTAAGEADKNFVFVGENIEFNGSASFDPNEPCDSIVAYNWDLDGDGSYDKFGEIVNHSYPTEGTYFVQLQVEDEWGATDELDNPIVIEVTIELMDPIAYAGAEPNPQTVCEEVHLFDDNSYDPDGGFIQTWEWDIDDDGTYELSGPDAYYTWDAPGTYYVDLRVTDDEGAFDTLDTVLEIIIENALPTAVAEASKDVAFEGEVITFDGTGSFDNDCNNEFIDEWAWDWDNDGEFDSFGSFVAHSWGNAGVYYVNLRVRDNEGGYDELDELIMITINPEPLAPIAIAEANPNPQTVCEDVTFDGSLSYDPDGGDLVNWEWDWDNDGTFDESGEIITHSWDVPGVYPVNLKVTDDESDTDELDIPLLITIQNALPTAVGNASDETPIICIDVTFDASGSYDNDCNGSIIAWEWDFDYDGTYEEPGEIVVHSFDTVGVYTVGLRVMDDEMEWDVLDVPITINAINALPTAVALANKFNVVVGEPIDFDGTGSHDNDCGGSITKWEWDWENDGTFDALGPHQTHSYDAEGTYFVNLRVTDDELETDDLDTLIEITVSNEFLPPIAFATAAPNPQSVCEPVTLSDDGSYDPDGGLINLYQWDIDNDGNYDLVGEDVDYTWNEIGVYPVFLKVTDDEGETDVIDEPLMIIIENVLPTAIADVDKDSGDTLTSFEFDGSLSHDNDCEGEILIWEWDFDYIDDIFTVDDSGEFVSHIFDTPGIYNVMLRVTDDEGGQDITDTPLVITVELPLECPNGIHEYIAGPGSDRGVQFYSSYVYSIMPRADIAYMNTGSMAGLGIVQGGPNSLVTFDPDFDTDDPIDDSIYKKPTGGVAGHIHVTSLDAAPIPDESFVAVVTSDKPGEFRILDAEVFMGNFYPFSHDFGIDAKIMAVDFDANGSIFVVVHEAGGINLYKAPYGGNITFYTDWSSAGIDMLIGTEFDVFDIACNWSNGLLYLFDAGVGNTGRVSVFDPANLTVVETYDSIYPVPIDYLSNPQSGIAGFADIEIDHVGENEICHIFLFARFGDTFSELGKFDENMNNVDKFLYEGSVWPTFTINTETAVNDRDIIMPGESTLGFWFADLYQ